jgi:hypothetical protein
MSKINSIIEQFKKYNTPFFSIYNGKDRVCINELNDQDEATEILETYLNGVEKGNFKIKLYKNILKSGITEKSEPYIIIPFEKQIERTAEDRALYYGGGGGTHFLSEKINDLQREIDFLKAKNEIAQNEINDEDVEEEVENNYLGAILGNPAIMGVLTTIATNIGANLFTRKPQPMAMAGIETTNIDDIINTLFEKGVTIDDLKKLSEMSKEKLSFLITMLKAQ